MDILKRSHLFKRSSDLPGDLAALESVNDDDALISLQHDAVCQPVTNRHINILPNFQHLLLVELVAVLWQLGGRILLHLNIGATIQSFYISSFQKPFCDNLAWFAFALLDHGGAARPESHQLTELLKISWCLFWWRYWISVNDADAAAFGDVRDDEDGEEDDDDKKDDLYRRGQRWSGRTPSGTPRGGTTGPGDSCCKEAGGRAAASNWVKLQLGVNLWAQLWRTMGLGKFSAHCLFHDYYNNTTFMWQKRKVLCQSLKVRNT